MIRQARHLLTEGDGLLVLTIRNDGIGKGNPHGRGGLDTNKLLKKNALWGECSTFFVTSSSHFLFSRAVAAFDIGFDSSLKLFARRT
ncbi:MAG TPA: hypothetical protein PLB32_26585 [Acidobacteriota bacterium]|nr:hypothetical protein [Acidobacteriota bacterium]HNB72026.1 hypothetical protein [Acidobacteriota bacterium]HNG96397.1 hypothetical protein [Acidobacteriota bacterium]